MFKVCRFFFAYRGFFLMAYFLSVIILVYLFSLPFFFWGILPIIFGFLIRFITSLYITNHTNGMQLESPTLATEGIYGWVRNPLYLSNIVVGFGLLLCVFKNDFWMFIFISFILILHHIFLILIEERYLYKIWGDVYEQYKIKVSSRFISFHFPETNWKLQNSFKNAFKNQMFNFLKSTGLVFVLWLFSK